MRDERHDTDASAEEHQKSDPFVVVESHLSPAKTFQASISITGMTCSSCVGNFTQALEAHPWIRTVDVNLFANSATVVFEGKDHLRDIQVAIEDVGYEAKLDDVLGLSRALLESWFGVIEADQKRGDSVVAGDAFWSLFKHSVPDYQSFVNHTAGFTLQYNNPENSAYIDGQISLVRQHFSCMQGIEVDGVPGYDAQYTSY